MVNELEDKNLTGYTRLVGDYKKTFGWSKRLQSSVGIRRYGGFQIGCRVEKKQTIVSLFIVSCTNLISLDYYLTVNDRCTQQTLLVNKTKDR